MLGLINQLASRKGPGRTELAFARGRMSDALLYFQLSLAANIGHIKWNQTIKYNCLIFKMHEIMSFETCPGRQCFSLRIPHDTSQTAKNKRRWLGLFGHVFGKKATGSEHVCTISLAIYQTKNDSLMKNHIFVEKCILRILRNYLNYCCPIRVNHGSFWGQK